MSIRAVFFDLGGTLFSYGKLRAFFGEALGAVAREHDLDASPDELQGVYRASVLSVMAEYMNRDYYLHRDLFAEAHRRMLEQLGISDSPDPAALSEGGLAAGPEGMGLSAVEVREGTRGMLTRLRDAGLHLSIVSNIDDDQFDAIWGRIGLGDLFDATTTSEEARSCKPHPGIFELALEKAGVSAEAVAFVGDSLHADVGGAQALGMTTFWLSQAPPEPDSPHAPDHVIGDLRELPGLLLG